MKKIIILSVLLILSNIACAEVIKQGDFKGTKGFITKNKHNIKGSWKLEKSEGGKLFLILDESFEADNAPDLKFFLSPLAGSKVNSKNAEKNAKLIYSFPVNQKSDKISGPQKIEIDIDASAITQYKSIVLHCKKYSELWGTSSL